MRLLKRFFAWIGKLMRRRRFIGQYSGAVTTPPSPPVDINDAVLLLLALGELQ